MKIITLKPLLCLALILCSAPAAAEDGQAGITTIEMQLEAGSGFYDAWPSGTTIHSGVGYIRPYGSADYWCGVDYDEEALFPSAREDMHWLLENSRDSNPLFCIYRLEGGDLHVLDVLVGTISRGEGFEKVDTIVNVVVGGTGEFEGASGVWVGTTSGRGEASEVAPGRSLPASILKLMQGYVRVPAAG